MNTKLWHPSHMIKKNSNLFKFENFLSKKYSRKFKSNYENIHRWTINNPGEFWDSIWDFSKVKGNKSNKKIKKSKKFFKNIFLPNSRLNFCENLLSKNTLLEVQLPQL